MVDAADAQRYYKNPIELPEAYRPKEKSWGEGKAFVEPREGSAA